jgi:hypothetical protein
VELLVPYHARRPIAEGSLLESNRVDIGVFAHNGDYYSAPAFVSLYSLDNELRIYDDNHRILSVDYQAEGARGNYVDPFLDTPKDWRDDYHYDAQGTLTGWTRTRGDSRQEFTPEGQVIVEPAKEGQPAKTLEVKYIAERLPNGQFAIKQKLVEE